MYTDEGKLYRRRTNTGITLLFAVHYNGDGWIHKQMTGQSLDMNMEGRDAVRP
jgi:hypothetical protein